MTANAKTRVPRTLFPPETRSRVTEEVDPGRVRRILVIRLAAMGDALLTTPLLEVLRSSFPTASIVYLTAVPAAAELLRNNPAVSDVLVSSRRIFEDIARMPPFDLTLDLSGSPVSQSIALCSGAAHRVGAGPASPLGGVPPYTIAARERPAARDILAHFARFTEALGLRRPSRTTRLLLGAEDRSAARLFLDGRADGDSRPWLALQPGCNRARPAWAPESFAELARRIERDLGFRILVLRGPTDRTAVAEEVHRLLGHAAVLAPLLPVRTYAGVLERCSVLVTSEGGAGHVAAALAVPTVALFEQPPTTYWFPYRPRMGMRALASTAGRPLAVKDVRAAVEEALAVGVAQPGVRRRRAG